MAARRLIIVLVVLFAISVGAAAIAPERRTPFSTEEETSSTSTSTSTSSTTTTTEEVPEEPPEGPDAPVVRDGEVVSAFIEASATEPETVRATVGDQLALAVAVVGGGQVEIPQLGLLETAAPSAPAQFNVLLRVPGAIPVTDAATGNVIGRLVITEPDVEPAPGQGAERKEGDGEDSRT